MDTNDKSGEYERPARTPDQPALADGSGKSVSTCGTIILVMVALCVLAIATILVRFFVGR